MTIIDKMLVPGSDQPWLSMEDWTLTNTYYLHWRHSHYDVICPAKISNGRLWRNTYYLHWRHSHDDVTWPETLAQYILPRLTSFTWWRHVASQDFGPIHTTHIDVILVFRKLNLFVYLCDFFCFHASQDYVLTPMFFVRIPGHCLCRRRLLLW